MYAEVRRRVPLPAIDQSPKSVAGLRSAIGGLFDYALEAIEAGAVPNQLPAPAVEQARRLARAGVGMERVVRRYVVGAEALHDLMAAEARALALGEQETEQFLGAVVATHRLLRDQVLDRIGEEYRREADSAVTARDRAELVHALLEGRPVTSDALGYDLAAHHVGAVATGPTADEALRQLARDLGRTLLKVTVGEQVIWGWLGGAHLAVPFLPVDRIASGPAFVAVQLALGEAATGPSGFRLSHRQALAASRVGPGRPGIARFTDAPLVAIALQDESLAEWLVDEFVRPLDEVQRETLRRYFATGFNAASAGHALGVRRETVRDRLDRIEMQLGCSISQRHAEIATALAVHDLNRDL